MVHHHNEASTDHRSHLMKRVIENNIREQQVGEPEVATVSTQLPTSTIILVAVFAVLGLTLFAGVAFSGYRAWKRKRDRLERLAAVPISNKRIWQDLTHVNDIETASVSDDKSELERPKKAILIASSDGSSSRYPSVDGKSMDMDTMDQNVGWVPQVKSGYGAAILAPRPSLKKQTQLKSQPVRMHYTNPSLSGSETLGMSPPPSYSVANNANSIGGVLSGVVEMDLGGKSRAADTKKIPLPVSGTPAQSGSAQAPPPPTPPASSAKFNLDVPAATTIPSPLPSPARSSSFVIRDVQASQPSEYSVPAQKVGHIKNKSSQTSITRLSSELPRLMTVLATFTPNLEDELPIKIGDTVRMLEEFRDGWCVVQHVGEYNAAKGVVPRICLQERKSVIPKHRSNSSLASSISGSLRR